MVQSVSICGTAVRSQSLHKSQMVDITSMYIYICSQAQNLGFSPTWAGFAEIIDAKRAVIPTLFQ